MQVDSIIYRNSQVERSKCGGACNPDPVNLIWEHAEDLRCAFLIASEFAVSFRCTTVAEKCSHGTVELSSSIYQQTLKPNHPQIIKNS